MAMTELMTELLHTTTTDRSGTAAPIGRGEAAASIPPAAEEPTVAPGTRRPDHSAPWLDDGLPTEDFAAASTRQLRIMANHAYRQLESEDPQVGAAERYARVVEELDHRARQASDRGPALQPRESFRDNQLYCRFELFVDGKLAAYLKYSLSGGQVNLLDGVEQAGFRDQGYDTTLMRHVLLNIHRRRLNVMPQCPMAFSFLADNPEYRLLGTRTRA